MIAALSIVGGVLVCVVGWCLSHAQRCADRDSKFAERLTRLEGKIQ